MRRHLILIAVVLHSLSATKPVQGGMPTVSLTDLTRLRLDTLSFFLMGVLLSAIVVRWLWNGLRQSFEWLPLLTLRQSLAVVVLWGMLFVIVLTMISGARELMTPDAWQRQGQLYVLSENPSDPDDGKGTRDQLQAVDDQRMADIKRLRSALHAYAADNNGLFPESREQLTSDVWTMSQASSEFAYAAGHHLTESEQILAWEPAVYDDCLVLLVSGDILHWSRLRLQDRLTNE